MSQKVPECPKDPIQTHRCPNGLKGVDPEISTMQLHHFMLQLLHQFMLLYFSHKVPLCLFDVGGSGGPFPVPDRGTFSTRFALVLPTAAPENWGKVWILSFDNGDEWWRLKT